MRRQINDAILPVTMLTTNHSAAQPGDESNNITAENNDSTATILQPTRVTAIQIAVSSATILSLAYMINP
jgi:hypothetical protein